MLQCFNATMLQCYNWECVIAGMHEIADSAKLMRECKKTLPNVFRFLHKAQYHKTGDEEKA